MQFSKRMDRFGDEIFGALNDKKLELEAEGRTLFNMSVGTPDFETPLHIREALAEAAMDPENWKYALRDLRRDHHAGHGLLLLRHAGGHGPCRHGARR